MAILLDVSDSMGGLMPLLLELLELVAAFCRRHVIDAVVYPWGPAYKLELHGPRGKRSIGAVIAAIRAHQIDDLCNGRTYWYPNGEAADADAVTASYRFVITDGQHTDMPKPGEPLPVARSIGKSPAPDWCIFVMVDVRFEVHCAQRTACENGTNPDDVSGESVVGAIVKGYADALRLRETYGSLEVLPVDSGTTRTPPEIVKDVAERLLGNIRSCTVGSPQPTAYTHKGWAKAGPVLVRGDIPPRDLGRVLRALHFLGKIDLDALAQEFMATTRTLARYASRTTLSAAAWHNLWHTGLLAASSAYQTAYQALFAEHPDECAELHAGVAIEKGRAATAAAAAAGPKIIALAGVTAGDMLSSLSAGKLDRLTCVVQNQLVVVSGTLPVPPATAAGALAMLSTLHDSITMNKHIAVALAAMLCDREFDKLNGAETAYVQGLCVQILAAYAAGELERLFGTRSGDPDPARCCPGNTLAFWVMLMYAENCDEAARGRAMAAVRVLSVIRATGSIVGRPYDHVVTTLNLPPAYITVMVLEPHKKDPQRNVPSLGFVVQLTTTNNTPIYMFLYPKPSDAVADACVFREKQLSCKRVVCCVQMAQSTLKRLRAIAVDMSIRNTGDAYGLRVREVLSYDPSATILKQVGTLMAAADVAATAGQFELVAAVIKDVEDTLKSCKGYVQARPMTELRRITPISARVVMGETPTVRGWDIPEEVYDTQVPISARVSRALEARPRPRPAAAVQLDEELCGVGEAALAALFPGRISEGIFCCDCVKPVDQPHPPGKMTRCKRCADKRPI